MPRLHFGCRGTTERRPGSKREALWSYSPEAINAYLTGDNATGKAILRDLVNQLDYFQFARAVAMTV